MSWLRKSPNKNKEHIRELNKIRCQKYYQRHKEELKESKKYGSLWAYRKHKKEQETLFKKALDDAQKTKERNLRAQMFL